MNPEKKTLPPEQETAPAEQWRNVLAGIYIVLALAGSILENTHQNHLNVLHRNGMLTPAEEFALKHFWDHIGDITNGFQVAAMSVLGTWGIQQVEKVRPSELLEKLRTALPWILGLIMATYIVDIETAQILPGYHGFFGIGWLRIPESQPQIWDIPAGFIGLLASALFLEQWKKHFAV